MKIAYNPKTEPALNSVPSDSKDIIFDLSGIAIYARGVKFDGKAPPVFKKHTISGGGYDGLVPAPSYNEDSKIRYLREDGIWEVPTTSSIHWDNITGKPSVFTPDQHIHTTNDIVALTNYIKATTAADLVVTDTLNAALGKLEYKADIAYSWYRSITDDDTDEIINKWDEIVDFVNNMSNDLTDEFVTRKTNLVITGVKTFRNAYETTTISNGEIIIDVNCYGGWARSTCFSNTSGDTTVFAKFGVYGSGVRSDGTGVNKINYLYLSHQDLDHSSATFKVYGDKATILNNEIYHKGNLKNLSDLNDDVVSGKYVQAKPAIHGNDDLNTKYDSLLAGSAAAANAPASYGSYLVMPYRKPYGNTKPDFAVQLFIPNGDTSAYQMYYRTSLADSWNEWRIVLDNNNFSKYALPLTGGTLTGKLIIDGSELNIRHRSLTPIKLQAASEDECTIKFQGTNSNGTSVNFGWLGIGPNGAFFENPNNVKNLIWHEANDGAGSGLDADLLDGYHSDDFIKSLIDSTDDYLDYRKKALFKVSFIQGQGDFGSLIIPTWISNRPDNYYLSELRFQNRAAPKFRYSHNGVVTMDWKTIAFTDSNVASATKLQTARTIWGLSFDGTGNVDGVFRLISSVGSGVAYHKILAYPTSPYGLVTRLYNTGNASLQAQRESDDNECFNLILNPFGGNVGIYTTTPAYKLDVNGIIRTNGFVKQDSSDSYVLLGGGDHKAISDFLLKSELANLELSNNLTTISKSLTVTADWMDTGITRNDLPSNGTYIVLVYTSAGTDPAYMYYCYWSGVMSWLRLYNTNDDEADEILLHRSGHAYGNTIYLRTKMVSNGDLKLLIAANKNIGAAYTYTFKFKRII